MRAFPPVDETAYFLAVAAVVFTERKGYLVPTLS